MFQTIAFIISLTTMPTATSSLAIPEAADDPCVSLLADAPNLDGLAVEMAVECSRDRAAIAMVSRRFERPSVRLAPPDWAFKRMRHQPELDAELASIGPRVNPFAFDDIDDPFAK